MYKSKSVGVVVPAYNEEQLITKTITTIPEYVDKIFIVNDCSKDRTGEILSRLAEKNKRIEIITHEKNRGLGQSLIDGYIRARESNMDITAVMAGDAQMDPYDLPAIIDPIVTGEADYSKGNRLLVSDVAEHMPFYRIVGNSGLTILTKFATGYWHVIDPQCGYTAISIYALKTIPIEKMRKGYGYNADILNMLNIMNFRVADVQVRPIYGEEQSNIKLYKYIPSVSILLVKLFFRRLIKKYLIRNFNPCCLSYFTAFFLLFFGSLPMSCLFFYRYFKFDEFPRTSLLVLMFLSITGLQILLSAIQYDMQDNRRLSVFPQENFKKNHNTIDPEDETG